MRRLQAQRPVPPLPPRQLPPRQPAFQQPRPVGHHGPSSTADGAQAAADLTGARAAGLAAARPSLSAPLDAGVRRLNVLPRPGPAAASNFACRGARPARSLAVHGLRQPAHVVQVPLPLLRLRSSSQLLKARASSSSWWRFSSSGCKL